MPRLSLAVLASSAPQPDVSDDHPSSIVLDDLIERVRAPGLQRLLLTACTDWTDRSLQRHVSPFDGATTASLPS